MTRSQLFKSRRSAGCSRTLIVNAWMRLKLSAARANALRRALEQLLAAHEPDADREGGKTPLLHLGMVEEAV